MESSARSPDESLGSVFAAFAANTAIATAKGTAAALTGSPALLAETLHTVADAGNEVLLSSRSAAAATRPTRRTRSATAPSATTGPCWRPSGCSSSAARSRSGTASGRWCTRPSSRRSGSASPSSSSRSFSTGSSRTVALRQLRRQAARRRQSVRDLLRESPDPTVVTVYLEDTIDVIGALVALIALVLHRVTGSAIADGLASVAIGGLLCFVASRLTRRNRALLTNQSVPERYVDRLHARLERVAEIHAVTRLEAVYLGPAEVLAAADVVMGEGLSGREVAAALARTRADIGTELPVIARLYLTPVEPLR